ncbi:Shikimate 5-dehydrogenase I alpha [Fulvivirga imtechensis AK7]|uniref:Shikimate 5-dehydrogenase I alpha n=1 Tax=Fulvivirga imtechensis AK7 TaxID=1237149 RepID=L8JSH6_9BACT|nr:shikimate dehydrogenase [Fulvivirga imtechensis]ELR71790.1 Shikimate 5-dehydrogenase I alpha [Fulvivirga imtechensis AK7]
MPELYGLIGKKLSHSFSKKFFTEKFEREGLDQCRYELFELREIDELPALISANPYLKGLNVTIPYKEAVQPFLYKVDDAALKIGAVNVIKVEAGKLYGYNSDFYGFKNSLMAWLEGNYKHRALVLGTGGASRAVVATLESLQIPYRLVSRQSVSNVLTYEEITPEIISTHHLLINTTPLGMYPNTSTIPQLPYEAVTPRHYLYDLVYNPLETAFLLQGKAHGASTKNGLEMLHLQAEESWRLWHH